MDIRSLEAFTAVAEELSFSSGADRLYISQSAASKYIRHLETELGVCLFDRTRRQIRLTPAGERMLPQAKALLSQYRSLLESVREETALHIAMLPVADSYGFAQLLADFPPGCPGSRFGWRNGKTSPFSVFWRKTSWTAPSAVYCRPTRSPGTAFFSAWRSWCFWWRTRGRRSPVWI